MCVVSSHANLHRDVAGGRVIVDGMQQNDSSGRSRTRVDHHQVRLTDVGRGCSRYKRGILSSREVPTQRTSHSLTAPRSCPPIIPREACGTEMGKCGSRNAFPGPGWLELRLQTRRLELDWRHQTDFFDDTTHADKPSKHLVPGRSLVHDSQSRCRAGLLVV